MSVTPQAFHYQLKNLADTEKYLIAYSGGVDSHVLLHLCSQLKNSPSGFEQSFSAVYIDHGLSYNASKWGKHCQHICFELDIPLTIIEVDATPKKGQSPEASARAARYQAFSEILEKNACLLTAQHLDDQAETLLLQLLRGSGTRGLSAMPRVKSFAQGFLCRPMLDYRKQDILAYARLHQLQWVEDESNEQQSFDRNYLRHTVLPQLESRWPAVKESFAKSAEILAESQRLLDDMARADMQSLRVPDQQGEAAKDKLRLEPLLAMLENAPEQQTALYDDQPLELARVKNVLRYWIHSNLMPLPSKKILEQIIHRVLPARADAMPLVSWKRDDIHCQVRKYRDILYLIDASALAKQAGETEPMLANAQYQLTEIQPLPLPSIQSVIQLVPATQISTRTAFDRQALLAQPLSVRFRKGGERFRRIADGQSRSLKHWFQEQGIPPWERSRLPLIYRGEELIQVGNVIVNNTLISDDGNNSLIIDWITKDVDEIGGNKR